MTEERLLWVSLNRPLQINRRHLSESQRATVAVKLETLRHGGARKPEQDANLHLEDGPPAMTRAVAAELLNVSPRSVAAAPKKPEAA